MHYLEVTFENFLGEHPQTPLEASHLELGIKYTDTCKLLHSKQRDLEIYMQINYKRENKNNNFPFRFGNEAFMG